MTPKQEAAIRALRASGSRLHERCPRCGLPRRMADLTGADGRTIYVHGYGPCDGCACMCMTPDTGDELHEPAPVEQTPETTPTLF